MIYLIMPPRSRRTGKSVESYKVQGNGVLVAEWVWRVAKTGRGQRSRVGDERSPAGNNFLSFLWPQYSF